jgi:hypothetical protein
VLTGLDQLTNGPDSSSSERKETTIAHHAQEDTQVERDTLLPKTQESTSTESVDGENHHHHTDHSLRVDTVPDTPDQTTHSETTLIVVSGLLRMIDMLDGSSSDMEETTCALLAHKPTMEATQPVDLQDQALTPSIPSPTGDNQDGGTSSSSSSQTTTADTIQNPTMELETSINASTGSRRTHHMLNTSSTDINLTGIAHLANGKADTDTPVKPVDHTLLSITHQSSFIKSSDGLSQLNHGKKITKEELEADTVPDTDNLLSTTDLHLLVLTGLERSTDMPNGSSSDLNPTGIAHHAQDPTMVELAALLPKTPTSTSIESRTGKLQLGDGKNGTEELLSTDTVPDTRNQHSTTEVSELVVTGSEELIEKLDTSSSENNPTGIVHHAHTPTLDTPLLELHTRTQRSTLT